MVSVFDTWSDLYNELRLDWSDIVEFADSVESACRVGVGLPHVVYYSGLTGLNLCPLLPTHFLSDRDRDVLMSFFWNRYSSNYVSWMFYLSLDPSVQTLHYYTSMYNELRSDLISREELPTITMADWLSPDASFQVFANPFDPTFYNVVRGDDIRASNLFRDELPYDVPLFYFVLPPVDFHAFLEMMVFSDAECREVLRAELPSFDGMRLRALLFDLVEMWNRHVAESLPDIERLSYWMTDSCWSDLQDELPFCLDRVLIVNKTLPENHFLFGFVYRGICYVPIDPAYNDEIILPSSVSGDLSWLEWWRGHHDEFTDWVTKVHSSALKDCSYEDRLMALLRARALNVDVLAFSVSGWGAGYVPVPELRVCFNNNNGEVFSFLYVLSPEWSNLPSKMQFLRDHERGEWDGQSVLDM